METMGYIMAFVLGILAAALVLNMIMDEKKGHKTNAERETNAEKETKRDKELRIQVENMLSYDGTARGQKEVYGERE